MERLGGVGRMMALMGVATFFFFFFLGADWDLEQRDRLRNKIQIKIPLRMISMKWKEDPKIGVTATNWRATFLFFFCYDNASSLARVRDYVIWDFSRLPRMSESPLTDDVHLFFLNFYIGITLYCKSGIHCNI